MEEGEILLFISPLSSTVKQELRTELENASWSSVRSKRYALLCFVIHPVPSSWIKSVLLAGTQGHPLLATIVLLSHKPSSKTELCLEVLKCLPSQALLWLLPCCGLSAVVCSSFQYSFSDFACPQEPLAYCCIALLLHNCNISTVNSGVVGWFIFIWQYILFLKLYLPDNSQHLLIN